MVSTSESASVKKFRTLATSRLDFGQWPLADRLSWNGLQIEVDGRKKDLEPQNDEHGGDDHGSRGGADPTPGIKNPVVTAIDHAGQKHRQAKQQIKRFHRQVIDKLFQNNAFAKTSQQAAWELLEHFANGQTGRFAPVARPHGYVADQSAQKIQTGQHGRLEKIGPV